MTQAQTESPQPLDIIHDDLLLELVCDLLDHGKQASFIARGSSMHPIIHDGDRVTISPCTAEDLRPGAVALYMASIPGSGQGIVIHRYLGKTPENTLLFRGDACPLPDPPVRPQQVRGKIIAVANRINVKSISSLWGRAFLAGGTTLPRCMALGSRLKSRLWQGPQIPFLPVTHGRLLRERGLLKVCLGDQDALLDLEEMETAVALAPSEYELLPLLLYRLREADLPWPDYAPSDSDSAELQAAFRSSQAEMALQWLHDTLADNHQHALLTKGAALSWEFYPEPHCRPAADIDILAREGSEAQLVDTLLEAGAALAEPEYPLSHYLRFKNEVALRLPGRKWPVLEIHWRGGSSPWYNHRCNCQRFWECARESAFGPNLLVMKSEAEFVHTVAHLAKHLPHLRMIWALDLALITRSDMDWEMVLQWLKEDHLSLPGAVVLRWLEDHIPGIVPDGMTRALATHARVHAARLEWSLLFRHDDTFSRVVEGFCQPDWATRSAFLRRLAFPARRQLERMFPARIDCPLPVLHLLRLCRRLR